MKNLIPAIALRIGMIAGLSAAMTSGEALADPAGLVTCRTQSNGRPFIEQGYDYYSTRNRVINQCVSDPYTNHNDCYQAVVCSEEGGGGYPPNPNPYPPNPNPNPYPPSNQVRCWTESRGYRFQTTGYDMYSTRRNVVNQCQSSYYTDRWECEQRAQCSNGGGYPPNPYPNPSQFRCEARSAGRVFRGNGSTLWDAQQRTQNACRSAPYTNPTECRNSMVCSQQ